MATVGHPLSDICNFVTQFYTGRQPNVGLSDTDGFLPGKTPGLPQVKQILEWYTATAGYDPRADITWGMAFSLWKLSAICQGIAARYATRQASSEQARIYAEKRGPTAESAWVLAKEAGAGDLEKAKL